MNLPFILNGEDVIANAAAETRLIDLLRDQFGLLEAKAGCYSGICSSCSIILNGNMVKACLIPIFKVAGSEIITIEGFSQTDEFIDIIQGFSESGLENCGFCNAAKILATQAFLGRNSRPSRELILSGFSGIKCRCTEPDELIQAVFAVAERRRKSIYGRD